jgi:hypothetical protein
MRTGDGKFEAVVTELFDYLKPDNDGNKGEAKVRSLGEFCDCDSAVAVIQKHRKRIDDADPVFNREGILDFNWSIH